MAVTQMLDSGTLYEKSFRLLEQLADCIQCPPAKMAREAEPDKQATARQATPTRGEPAEIEPLVVLKVEPSPGGDSKCPAGKKVIVGSLRTTSEDRWACKVPSCTRGFHRLKDCRLFHKMEPEDRFKLVDHHGLCLSCLTPAHGRAARSCPYEEERANTCKRTACRR
jgi:hypothetical protein